VFRVVRRRFAVGLDSLTHFSFKGASRGEQLVDATGFEPGRHETFSSK